MQEKYLDKKKGLLLDQFVLCVIGLFCICYSVFWSNFAKIRLVLPFLNFPVFVGELLLAFCLIAFFIKWRIKGIHFSKWHLLWGVYVLWVLVKAVEGYVEYGALSFRNAALFYYPLFGLIGYSFFRKEFFSQNLIVFYLTILLFVKNAILMECYSYPYFALALALVMVVKKRWVKISYAILIFLTFPMQTFLNDSKSFVVGNILALFFVAFSFLLFIKRKRHWNILLGLLFIISLIGSVLKFSVHTQRKIFSKPKEIADVFNEADEYIKMNQDVFISRDLKVRLFNEKGGFGKYILGAERNDQDDKEEKEGVIEAITKDIEQTRAKIYDAKTEEIAKKEIMHLRERLKKNVAFAKKRMDDTKSVKEVEDIVKRSKTAIKVLDEFLEKGQGNALNNKDKVLGKSLSNLKQLKILKYSFRRSYGRSVKEEYTNILFRYLLWRDMCVELFNEKPMFGFSFGKPQRSKSLEILNIAGGEWSRDGWVTPHNSYLHLIYRGGVVGVLMIFGMFGSLLFAIRKFFMEKNFWGMILLSPLVYWMVVANFVLFLEFPYQAIPFWSYFGMLMAHVNSK